MRPADARARARRPRRWLGLAAVLALVAGAGPRSTLGSASGQAPVACGPGQTLQASAMIDHLGVTTHLNYPQSPYADVAAVERALRFLGVGLVRDMADAPTMRGPHQALAAQGVRFDFVAPGGAQEIGALGAELAAFETRHPGAIRYVEGPNEINQWPVTLAGSSGLAAGVRAQAELFRRIRSHPELHAAGIVNLSLAGYGPETYAPLGDMSASADRGNAHIYFPDGAQPQPTFAQALAWAQAVTPQRPMAVTETGYGSVPDGRVGVDEPTQARLILNLLFDAACAGVAPVILYELADDQSSGGGGWNHYGLFRSDWSPKPAAFAVHNLVQALQGASAGVPAGRAAPPAVHVAGLENGHAVRLETPRHGRELVLWAEPRIWDAGARARRPAPVETAVLQLDRPVGAFAVYDPLQAASPVAIRPGGQRLVVPVADHPVIVELRP